ncbi:MAG TPA: NlpC/P60 family protein, partial [bacterium]
NVQPGDLLFFGPRPERIIHVAIYLGDHLYIHSSASVHINSLDPEHDLYNEYRHKTLQSIKRVLPNS